MEHEINLKLKELYESKLSKVSKLLIDINAKLDHDNKATNPLLIKIDDSYFNSDLRIMFFGQETNYWHGEVNNGEFSSEVEPLLNLYEKFYLSGYCYSPYGKHFWNGINRFKQLLSKAIDTKIGLVWNNVIKIGKCSKGTPNKSILDLQFQSFNVIKNEIDILKPHLLIFFSSHKYDDFIAMSLGDFEKQKILNFDIQELCKIENQLIPPSFRTYHPNYLWRNDINRYLSTMIKEIIKETS